LGLEGVYGETCVSSGGCKENKQKLLAVYTCTFPYEIHFWPHKVIGVLWYFCIFVLLNSCQPLIELVEYICSYFSIGVP